MTPQDYRARLQNAVIPNLILVRQLLDDYERTDRRYRSLIQAIAYPRRGTNEETMTLQQFADNLKAQFTLEDVI